MLPRNSPQHTFAMLELMWFQRCRRISLWVLLLGAGSLGAAAWGEKAPPAETNGEAAPAEDQHAPLPVTIRTSVIYGELLGMAAWVTYLFAALQDYGLQKEGNAAGEFFLLSFVWIMVFGGLGGGLISGILHALLFPSKRFPTLSVLMRDVVLELWMLLVLVHNKTGLSSYLQEKNQKEQFNIPCLVTFIFIGATEIARCYRHWRGLSRKVALKSSASHGTSWGLVHGLFSGIWEMLLDQEPTQEDKKPMTSWVLYYTLLGWGYGLLSRFFQQKRFFVHHPRIAAAYMHVAWPIFVLGTDLLYGLLVGKKNSSAETEKRYMYTYMAGFFAVILYINIIEGLGEYAEKLMRKGQENSAHEEETLQKRAKKFSMFTVKEGMTEEEQ